MNSFTPSERNKTLLWYIDELSGHLRQERDDAVAEKIEWQKRARDAELRLRYALGSESERHEMMHSCTWPRGSERVFGERINWLYLRHPVPE